MRRALHHKRLLASIPGHARVYEVDGAAVRRSHVEFVEGGHGQVYRWIPKNEIWVERMADPTDEVFNAVHEAIEFDLMRDHGWSYERAHAAANRLEVRLRRMFGRRSMRRRAA